MERSPKYGSMKHLPWSEEDEARRNKVIDSVDDMIFTETEVVMTEKIDGGNSCLTKDKVYARSHGHEAVHESFDLLKKKHAEEYSHKIPEHLAIYGEWVYAKHSIKYTELPAYFITFSVFNMETETWLSWDETKKVAKEIGLETAPVIKRGEWDREEFKVEPEGESFYGDTREGYVLRTASAFKHDMFKKAMAKCVRNNHVQTDEHWKRKEIEPNELR